MRKTKIVATIGPASSSKEIFKKLVKAGLNVARLNFSHGTLESHEKMIDVIKEVRRQLDEPVAIMLDTKGPEIRLGEIDGNYLLKEGDKYILFNEELIGDSKGCSISYKGLYNDLKIGDNILVDDGLITLKVDEIKEKDIYTSVIFGGEIKSNKGVNLPSVNINLEAITEKDKKDILFGIEKGVDFIAASFIRKKEDVLEIRKLLEDNEAKDIQIISKIENREGYDKIDEILQVSDGIMVARGDLGVEIPIEEIPIAQKEIIRKCNKLAKPVITATQMLDSMIRNPSPTRAEATDIANAIFDGTDSIMLSGETASGKYPVEAVKVMAKIATNTELNLDYESLLNQTDNYEYHDSVTYAVSKATVETAHNLNAKAILVATNSGFTSYKVAMHHPRCSIIAATPFQRVRRKLSLVRGVYTTLIEKATDTDALFLEIENSAINKGYIKNGDLVILTAGVPVGVSGTTNIMKAHFVGSIILKGLGMAKGRVTSTVRVVKNLSDAKNIKKGDIICAKALDSDYSEYINLCSAIVTEEKGYTCYSAIVSLALGIPVIVGVNNATDIIEDNTVITVDSQVGLVYNTHLG